MDLIPLNRTPRLSAIAAAVLALTACSTTPATGQRQMSSPAPVPVSTKTSVSSHHAPASPPIQVRQDAPQVYVVRRGDTLWGIAGHYLESPWQWPWLWYANPRIENPNLIYPGDVLHFISVNGRPRLIDTGPGGRWGAAPAATTVVKPHVRVEPLSRATPAFDATALRAFLHGPRVVAAGEIEQAPVLVAFEGGQMLGTAGDHAYADALPAHAAALWQVVHIGQSYLDPVTGDRLGYEAVPTAQAQIVRSGKPAELVLSGNLRETQAGDRLLPPVDRIPLDFVPHPPAKAVEGQVIDVFEGLDVIGQGDIVTLDRGADAGLNPGTVLRLFEPPQTVPNPVGGTSHLPPQPVGLIMVFQATPKLAYALVMNVTGAAKVMDTFAPPDQDVGTGTARN